MSKAMEEKINVLEFEIGSLKARLDDDSKIAELTRRIAACETLAGISSGGQDQGDDDRDDEYIKDE